jgi:hypothetical protein
MARVSVYIESGAKRVFACAVDWPGWCRAGKDQALALEALGQYAERYGRVARQAEIDFPENIEFDVVERREGGGGTDFGVPSAITDADRSSLTPKQRERLAALVDAAWHIFDGVASKAPGTLRKGPRGGGRDRDTVIEHVLGADVGYAYQIGIRAKQPPIDHKAAIKALRQSVLEVLRGPKDPAPEVPKKPWPRRYAAQRIAWHALDHAWEIEDRSE